MTIWPRATSDRKERLHPHHKIRRGSRKRDGVRTATIEIRITMDYIIDAKGKRLGRVATEIATILQGKKKADYAPNKVSTDRAVVKNIKLITVSGDKMQQRVYYRHTGYMGHVKEETLEERFKKDPRKMLRETVRHMLPKNFLNTPRLKQLVFDDNAS